MAACEDAGGCFYSDRSNKVIFTTMLYASPVLSKVTSNVFINLT